MGKLIGLMGSMGMLLLIGALLMVFLHHAGVLSQANIRRLRLSCIIVLSVAVVYWFAAYLMRSAVYGQGTVEISDFTTLIPSTALKKTLDGLHVPAFEGFFSSIYLFLGHFIGKILFEEYVLGGMVLVFLLLLGGVFLLLYRGEKILGERNAKEMVGLLFSLPGAYFLFLPGWPCLVFFLISLLLCIAFCKMQPVSFKHTPSVFTIAYVLCAVSSGALLFASVTGKLM